MRSLEKKFKKEQTPGEGNCLFYSLSYLIFQDFAYHIVIRQKICDYLSEHNYNDDDFDRREAEKKINNMRNDGVYGTGYELEAFSKLCKIRITYYIRHIENMNKNKDDKLTRHVYGKKYPENFAILL